MSEQLSVKCACGSENHTIEFHLSIHDGWPMFYSAAKINTNLPWYKRLMLAVAYLFKSAPAHGHYDMCVLDENAAKQLQEMANRYLVVLHAAGYSELEAPVPISKVVDSMGLEAFRRDVKEFTTRATDSPEKAIAVLCASGIYNPDGTLSDDYK